MKIEDLTIDQLLDLNDLICRRIDELRARQAMEAICRLRLGVQVHFDAAEGRVFGRVIKINRKTIVVESEDRRQWKLPAAMVTPIKDV
jgi:hypothetical protein